MKNWKFDTMKFMGAQTISLFGSSLVQYAIIWYITLHTQSGFMMSIATLCGYVPQMCISLFAGVWVDRYSRKLMCMLSDGIIACATLIVMICFFMGIGSVELLFLVLLIRSFMTGIQTPAVSAILPQIVPEEALVKANGIQSTINSLMMFLSPALSGMILSIMDIQYTFLIDILTAIIGIGIMFWVHVPSYEKQLSQISMKEDMKITQVYLKQKKMIASFLLFMFLVSFFISPAAFLTPLMVSRFYGAEVWRLSISEMTFSLGAVAGGILISSWGGFKEHLTTVLAATILYGAMMIGLGISSSYVIYLIFNCLIGISMPCFNAPAQSYLQKEVDTSMLGRIFSLVQIVNACALPLGTVIFGPLADLFDIHLIFIITGMIVIFFGAFWLYLRKKIGKEQEKIA